MTLQNGRAAMATATAFVLVLSLVAAPDAAAVATATGAGIRITDPKGGPVAQATVSLTFKGETRTADTDDDGLVAIVFGKPDTATERRGAIVLIGDGSGTITYPGGPAGGEAFTVKAGVLSMTPPAAADTPRAARAISKKTKIGIGAGAGVVLVGVLAAGGGSESGAAAPPQAPAAPAPVTPPSTPAAPSGAPPTGAFGVNLLCINDPGRHDPTLRGGQVNQLSVSGATASVTFTGPAPWVTVSGTWDPANGRFTATGRGTVAGFPNIRCNFDGTLTPAGVLEGDYVIGVGGGLPGGQATTYKVTGRKN